MGDDVRMDGLVGWLVSWYVSAGILLAMETIALMRHGSVECSNLSTRIHK